MDDQGTTPLSTEPATYNMTVMPTKDQALYTAYNIAMLVTTAWIMFSMGSGTKLEVIKERLKRPVSNLILYVCTLWISLQFSMLRHHCAFIECSTWSKESSLESSGCSVFPCEASQ